jgi:hypothetical protein
MSDLIDRQAAIDAVAEGLKRTFIEYKDVAEKLLNEVPSAQPETHDKRTGTHACDLISRQAAIDALRAAYWDKNIQSAKDDPCIVDAMTDWAIRQIKVLPSAQPQQHWIPCSERLPEEKDAGILKKHGISKMSKIVLATVEVKGERMTTTACTYDGEWDWNMKYAFPDYKIIAWMPLPLPYKGEQE